MKRIKNQNVLVGPFTQDGIGTVAMKICEQFKERITSMRGEGVNLYNRSIKDPNAPAYYRESYDMYFSVDNRAIEIDVRAQGTSERRRRKYIPLIKMAITYKVTISYTRHDWEKTKYNKKGFKREFWSTKNSFNLNLVFNAIDEGIKYLMERRKREKAEQAIEEIEKIAFDGMLVGEWEGKASSNLSISDNVHHYDTTLETGNEVDNITAIIYEKLDEKGKKYFQLKNLQLAFEPKDIYKEIREYRFNDPDKIREIMEELKAVAVKISNILKESLYVKKEI